MGYFDNVLTSQWLFDANLNLKSKDQFATVLRFKEIDGVSGQKGNTLLIYEKNSGSYKVKKVYNIDDEMPSIMSFRLKKVITPAVAMTDILWFYNNAITVLSNENEKFNSMING